MRERLVFDPEPGVDSAVGAAIAALRESRRRTLRDLAGVAVALLDTPGPPGSNSLGTIIYHIALIEMAWLYEEILVRDTLPPELDALLPYPVRDDAGRLTVVRGESLDQHLERLHATRAHLMEHLCHMDVVELRRIRSLPAYDVTPEWVLFHLTQHEAEHRSEIGRLLGRPSH